MSEEYIVDRSKITRPPTHPGVIFAHTVMPELRTRRTIGEIATLLGVSRQTLHHVLAGESVSTADMAVRLGKLCGNRPGLWLSLATWTVAACWTAHDRRTGYAGPVRSGSPRPPFAGTAVIALKR